MATIIISKEQQQAFKSNESAYKSHIPYGYNSSMQDRMGAVCNTSSFSKIYSAVRDYYDSRDWG